DLARYQLLARPALAVDEDVDVRLGDPLEDGEEALHRRAVPDETSEGRHERDADGCVAGWADAQHRLSDGQHALALDLGREDAHAPESRAVARVRVDHAPDAAFADDAAVKARDCRIGEHEIV